ncbi:hypothetical protein SAMN05216296_1958 [Pseudomonas pohangensis]|uniref:Lipoprotein n=2 Tax=Pseudomonas pohangensis TaxID=364197 RepID=A0A1H2G0U3_9PSED|nr:hypothetical protein SAMN05216296_1958 [Pseudomonas pohangensis]
MRLKLARYVLPLVSAAVLAGCGGGAFDGSYAAGSGLLTGELLTVEDGEAVIQTFNLANRQLLRSTPYEVDERPGKLILTGEGQRTYVFVRAVDERGLQCISDTCGWLSKLPKNWKAVDG